MLFMTYCLALLAIPDTKNWSLITSCEWRLHRLQMQVRNSIADLCETDVDTEIHNCLKRKIC